VSILKNLSQNCKIAVTEKLCENKKNLIDFEGADYPIRFEALFGHP